MDAFSFECSNWQVFLYVSLPSFLDTFFSCQILIHSIITRHPKYLIPTSARMCKKNGPSPGEQFAVNIYTYEDTVLSKDGTAAD